MADDIKMMPTFGLGYSVEGQVRELRKAGLTRVILQVPFDLLNEEWAQRNHSQSLSRLAERGGLSADEAVAIIEKRRHRTIGIVAAQRALAEHLARYEGDHHAHD